jgi:hypothetical protein
MPIAGNGCPSISDYLRKSAAKLDLRLVFSVVFFAPFAVNRLAEC